eukprot:Skav203192  [mRNA]  locus=scaffold3430:4676:8188:+ [translate_table: standard]
MVEGEFFYYIDAIKVIKAELIDESIEDYDIFADELTDAKHNVSIFNRYIQTEVNPDCLRFKDAIKKKGHVNNECWMNTLLDHYSDTLFKHKRGSLARNICREKILECIGKTDEEFKQRGASINEMEKVFKEFKIKARLYDIDSNLIFKHDPENFNSCRIITFNGLVANSHIYTLNHDLKSIKRREDGEEYGKLTLSNNYYLNEKKEPMKYKMIKSIDDLLKLKEENEYKLILENNDLDKALFDLKEAGYTPQVRYNAHKTSQIIMELTHKITEKKTKTVKYTIETQSLNEDKIDEDIAVNTIEKYNKVSEEMFKFHKQLFNENFKSYYNEDDVKILNECRTIVPNGRFYGRDTFDDIRKCSIDRRKAYSYQAKMISKIPVFKEFDVWQHYDYSKCDVHRNGNYTLYLVKVCQANVFFNKKFNLIYGKHLKELIKRGVAMKIIVYKKPSFIHKVKFNKALEDLYKSKISDNENENNKIHKTIANIAFGLWEKSFNKKTVSRIFSNLKEALAHQKKYDGRIYVLDEVEIEKYQEWKEDSDSEDEYIKEWLLQNHNFEMYDAYEKLKARGIEVYAVKTDAFHIAYEDLKKAKKVLKFGSEIGDWRFEKNDVKQVENIYSWQSNDIPKLPVYKTERIEVEDEWDTEAIAKQIIEKKQVMIRAKYAGSGKSYIGKHFEKMGYRTLFVVPQNMLKQECDCEAVTLNTFFSVPVHKGDKLPLFDYSEFNVIFFDEIYMASPYILNRIRQFAINNPNLIVIGAGDVKQLPSIEPFTNVRNVEHYVDACMDIIFKNNIFLKICKRVGGKDTEHGERNRRKLDDIYNDWWIKEMPLKEWIDKHFKYTDDIMISENNIAYTNLRCQAVSNEIRKKLNKQAKYEVDEILICRLYRMDEFGKLNVNIRWKIEKVEGKKVKIRDIKDKKNVRTYDEEIIEKHFRYAYCATTHSRQGQSIDGNLIIHEWNKSYLVSREWIYTSITRARDINKIYFYKNEKGDTDMFEGLLMNYFKNKVDGYKAQDRKAQRDIDEDEYVDEQFCLNLFKSCCSNCGVQFNIEMRQGRLSSNFTLQRVDNEIPHSKNNCIGYCCYCNSSAH